MENAWNFKMQKQTFLSSLCLNPDFSPDGTAGCSLEEHRSRQELLGRGAEARKPADLP